MRRPIAIAAAVGTLAVAGTAIAGPGPLGGVFREDRDERRQEFARDLASKLDGVSAQEVDGALRELHAERRAEHRAELARALAGKLEGVSAGDVEQALEKAEERMRQAFEERQRPDRELFVETLASELDKSEREIRNALRAARRDRLESKLDEAVREGRISEERADQIRERIEEGRPGLRLRFRGGGPGGPHGPGGPGGFAMPLPPP
jgi:hypothetical protein